MKPDVMLLGSFPRATHAEMECRFNVHYDPHVPPLETLDGDLIRRVRAIATEANRGVPRAYIENMPQLEIISCFGVGTDLIDLHSAQAHDIPVTNTPDLVTEDCADLAIGLMLASARQILFADRFIRDGRWEAGPIPFGRKVNGKTVGILGLGKIGAAIATRAEGFGMTIFYHGRTPKLAVPYEYVPDLVDMAERSDFLVVSCKGGDATRGLVSALVMEALGPQGTLINIARGSVIDEAALIDRIRDGALGHAALDVFENEPHVPAELLALPNVIVQPHHGSATLETRTAMGKLMIDNIVAKFEGRPLLTPA